MMLLRSIGLLFIVTTPAWAGVQAIAAPADCTIPGGIRDIRPDPDAGPTRVTVGLYVIDVSAVNDAAQTFRADFFLRLQWSDPRLVSESRSTSPAGCRVGLGDVWNPSIVVLNQRELRPHFPSLITIDPAGRARYDQRFTGDLSIPLDLREFPGDKQALSIELISLVHGPDEVLLTVDEQLTGRSEEFSIADWTVAPGEAAIDALPVKPTGRDYSRFAYTMRANRHVGFYFWKVLFPLSLIVFMSWTVFWIDPKELGPQLGISASAVLTLIAFQFSLGYFLPRVSYLTRLDRFLVGATILVFGALAEATVTSLLARRGKAALSRALDRFSRWFFAGVFLLVVVISAI